MRGTAFDPGLTPEIRTITVPYKLKGDFSVLSKVMTLALSVRSLEKVVSAPTKLYLNKTTYDILYMQQCSSRTVLDL